MASAASASAGQGSASTRASARVRGDGGWAAGAVAVATSAGGIDKEMGAAVDQAEPGAGDLDPCIVARAGDERAVGRVGEHGRPRHEHLDALGVLAEARQ